MKNGIDSVVISTIPYRFCSVFLATTGLLVNSIRRQTSTEHLHFTLLIVFSDIR